MVVLPTHRGPRASGSKDPKQTSSGHLPQIKSEGKERRGGDTRKGFVSLRPTLGIQWTNISKTVLEVQKILLGLYEENVGQKMVEYVQVCSEGQRDHCLGVSHG